MRTTLRLLSGSVGLLVVLSVAGCGGEEPATTERVLTEQQAKRALLTASDIGPGYRRQPADDDDDDDSDGVDCLSAAARVLDATKGATEVEVEYLRRVGDRGAGVTVQSGVSSYAEPGRAEASLNDLRDAMRDCETAEYEQGGGAVRFDISVSEGRTAEALDQQLNLELDGEITSGANTLPLVVQLRYFRIGNHSGTLSVTAVNAPGRASEVHRLLELSVNRFVAAVGQAS